MDISILILFFNRPDVLEKVFAEVRKAKPARLFLYQDGARGERDMPGIMACRKIVDNIDWPCEVQRMYQEKNYGCDPSEFISQRWAFSQVDIFRSRSMCAKSVRFKRYFHHPLRDGFGR